MKPSSWDKQLGMVSPLKSAAIQSGQTNHPSKNEVELDVSHHIHLSLEGKGKYFFLDILFHRMSATTIRQGAVVQGYFSFCESGVSYSVTTVTLATAFAPGLSSLVAM